MDIFDFAKIMADKAIKKGFRIKQLSIIQGMGFSQETPYSVLYFLEKFNFIKSYDSKIEITEIGEKYFEKILKIAYLVKNNSVGFENDTGKVIGNILYAFTDWKKSFTSSEQILKYIDETWKKIEEVKKKNPSIYSYFLFLLPRYNFEEYDDPLTLLEKLKKYLEEH